MEDNSAQRFNEEDMPEDCFCPITQEIMDEPVIAADGHSYEKKAIEKWFEQGNNSSPKTGAKLESTALTPNYTLRSLINCLKKPLKAKVNEYDPKLSNNNQPKVVPSNANVNSSFFYKAPSFESPIPPLVNMDLQNELIEKISSSQLDAIQVLLTQGASLTHPNKNGIYPLTAAAYSFNFLTIQYIEEKLGLEAGIYWSKIDLNNFEAHFRNQMPERRPTGLSRASYEWLANWYSVNSNKAWNAKYDKFIVDNWFKGGVTGWNEEDWQKRGEHIRSKAGNFGKEIWSGYEWSSYKIYRPPVKTHDESVDEIISGLIQCKDYVTTKARAQFENKMVHF